MFVVFRTFTYAVLFIGIILIFVPARILAWSGITRPDTIGLQQIAGPVIVASGTALALWCVIAFVSVGRGTPAPFDPPRLLVTRGPYRSVRNPMYIGAGSALVGAVLYYESLSLLGYTCCFLWICHIFVVGYEEPRLNRTFEHDYESYCRQVRRWCPKIQGRGE